jgi:hypothetical protein
MSEVAQTKVALATRGAVADAEPSDGATKILQRIWLVDRRARNGESPITPLTDVPCEELNSLYAALVDQNGGQLLLSCEHNTILGCSNEEQDTSCENTCAVRSMRVAQRCNCAP